MPFAGSGRTCNAVPLVLLPATPYPHNLCLPHCPATTAPSCVATAPTRRRPFRLPPTVPPTLLGGLRASHSFPATFAAFSYDTFMAVQGRIYPGLSAYIPRDALHSAHLLLPTTCHRAFGLTGGAGATVLLPGAHAYPACSTARRLAHPPTYPCRTAVRFTHLSPTTHCDRVLLPHNCLEFC